MIEIKIEKASHLGYEVSGHADFSENGKDIVCAGVSCLSTTILNALTDLMDLGERLSYYYIDSEDFPEISLEIDTSGLNERDEDFCKLLIETFELGIRSIDESYPGYIDIIEEVE